MDEMMGDSEEMGDIWEACKEAGLIDISYGRWCVVCKSVREDMKLDDSLKRGLVELAKWWRCPADEAAERWRETLTAGKHERAKAKAMWAKVKDERAAVNADIDAVNTETDRVDAERAKMDAEREELAKLRDLVGRYDKELAWWQQAPPGDVVKRQEAIRANRAAQNNNKGAG